MIISVCIVLFVKGVIGSGVEKNNQNLTCKPGEAMSNIEWSEIDGKYKKFKISCITLENVCHEVRRHLKTPGSNWKHFSSNWKLEVF